MRLPIKFIAVAGVIVSAVLSWAVFQPASGKSLDQFMPEGALLCIQATNFSGLLKEWNGSAEKAQWVKSDNYEVFSKSRLFLRLGRASDEFAIAVGLPPNMKFLNEAAGGETALAVYDIGEMHFLYISRMGSGGFLQSSLWQSRNKFEPRTAAGHPFFYRKDPASEREVAFAVVDDTLVLGTQVDLVAGALELMSSGKGRTLQQESWYSQAIAAAARPVGDLRMVLQMEKIAVTPHFRTYWVQQNITEMQSCSSAVSDLYREGDLYREERVILPKAAAEDDAAITLSSAAVTSLFTLAPRDGGFYRVSPTTAKDSLAAVEKKILAPHFGAAAVTRLAPTVQLGTGETGSTTDLETRIDVEPVSRTVNEGSLDALRKQFDAAAPEAMLVIESTRKNNDGVLVQIPTTIVLHATSTWDAQALQQGMQKAISSGVTTANLGTQWHQNKDGYYELDGLAPVFLAVRGKVLYVANDAASISAVLNAKTSIVAQPVVYAAGFNHNVERQNFNQLTELVDRGASVGQDEPAFFSRNISSFSNAFAQVGAVDVVTHRSKDKITQTVTYHWNH